MSFGLRAGLRKYQHSANAEANHAIRDHIWQHWRTRAVALAFANRYSPPLIASRLLRAANGFFLKTTSSGETHGGP